MLRLLAVWMWVVDKWASMKEFAHRHHVACHHAHNGTHLCYFYWVATHGPYHIAAMALLVLGVVFWMFKVEE